MGFRKIKILVVEDDSAISQIIDYRLSQDGYAVILAKNGEEALIEVAKGKPDLILLDIILPKINGFDVLKRIKNQPETKSIDVIVFSNLSQKEDVARAKEYGALDFLVKADFSADGLANFINKHFSKNKQA